MKRMIYVLLLCFTVLGFSQQKEIILWPTGVPGSIENTSYEEAYTYDALAQLRGVSKVSEPTLTPFLADVSIASGAAVIICPGGGYTHLAINKEGYKVAKWLNTLGVSAFVLKYRMPTDETMVAKTVGPLQDAQEAIRMVRKNASRWNIDKDKVGIMGFSAGGHLASTLSTHFNDNVYESDEAISARPDFSVLVYPVISMKNGVTHKGSKRSLLGDAPSEELIKHYSNALQINDTTPPAFLVHATDDTVVPVENSLEYYNTLKQYNVPAELHVYESGGHGFGLGVSGTNTNWPQDLKHWFLAHGLLKKDEVYLFAYFVGNGENGLHFAYSEDGMNWEALRDGMSYVTPNVGKDKLMRDPCIIKGGDGKYHMVWTVSWTNNGVGYASSDDLVHWSLQQFLPVMAGQQGTRNTWAPEITYDDSIGVYMIYWASTIEGKFPKTKNKKENGYNHRMYFTTTKDFKSFTDTKLLYEPGFNVIDSSIIKWDDKFIMFLKDETIEPEEKNIKMAFSDTLEGPYSQAGESITGDYWAEGPTAIRIDGTWIVYFDKYEDHSYGAVSSSNLMNWKDISNQIHFPDGVRHGTVFKVSRGVLKGLK